MTWDELEQNGFVAVYAEYQRGKKLISIYLYHLKQKNIIRAHVNTINTETQRYEEPHFTVEEESLFAMRLNLTFEHLIPVSKLSWRGY